jgi:hypothetical protein
VEVRGKEQTREVKSTQTNPPLNHIEVFLLGDKDSTRGTYHHLPTLTIPIKSSTKQTTNLIPLPLSMKPTTIEPV